MIKIENLCKSFRTEEVETIALNNVSLEVKEDTDATRYQLTVHADDMKRVIGRGGKTIRALQSLVRIIGIKNEKKIFLNLLEPCSPQ